MSYGHYSPYAQGNRNASGGPPGARPSIPPPSYAYPPPAMPPFRPYEAYGREPPRPQHPYEQPRPADDSYDPYRPSSNAYDPGRPNLDVAYPRQQAYPPARPQSPPRAVQRPAASTSELALVTPPHTIDIEGHTAVVHKLPPSTLPLTKYIAVNREDALDLHRHLTSRNASIWYADGSNRAGEGWSAAVEWIFDPGRSGSKMRGCVGDGDALDSELGGIFKAVEGFHELLRQSLKNATIMPNHLIIFSTSQAAIVNIDTSRRPEAVKFDGLWREICSEFINAHLTLAWLPSQNVIEGHVLANKIAVVGATNAWSKKKKDNVLPDVYRRPGGGDPAPPGSSQPGPWQTGDADPSFRKMPFERPVHIRSPPMPIQDRPALHPGSSPRAQPSRPTNAPEDEIPKEGSVFVTHFPEHASAKDIGILFSQFGSIESVDIYHVSPEHPRLAYVAYVDHAAGLAAIDALHRRAIGLDSAFAIDNHDDFEVWRNWTGTLTVVKSEPPLLVPSSVVDDFPDLPEWAKRGANTQPEAVPAEGTDHKRPAPGSEGPLSPNSRTPSSPRKRSRQDRNSVESVPPTRAQSASRDPLPVTDSGLGLTTIKNDVAHKITLEAPSTPNGQNAALSIPTNGTLQAIDDTRPAYLPPTPDTGSRAPTAPLAANEVADSKEQRPLTNSAAEPQEDPIVLSAKTLHGLIDLTRNVFSKHEANNWIAHSCLIAFELDQARRALQGDLFATDEAFLTGRDHEQILSSRGLTPQRVDSFIQKVLKVLDGIAAAEDEPSGQDNSKQNLSDLQDQLAAALDQYPKETREAAMSAGRVMEYLLRGKELQEKKRLEVERRVKVLEGMVKIGEVVSGVVRFLLTEDQ